MSLFSSILPCLLAAFGLGALLGWALKSLFGDNRITELEESWAARLRGKESEWETGNARMRTQLTTLQTNFDASATTLRTREAELADWEAKYSTLEADLTAKSAELEKANATWNSKYSLLEADLSARSADLAKTNSDWDGKYALLAAALAAKTADFDKSGADWSGKNKALETEILALRKRVVELEAASGQAKDWESKYLTTVQNKDAEIGKLQSRVGELEPLTVQAKDWEMKYLKVSGDKDSEIKELQRKLGELEPLRGQVKDWEIKYNAILQEREAESAKLRGRISELEPLSVQVSDWQSKYQTTVAEKDETISSLRNQLTAASAAATVATVATAATSTSAPAATSGGDLVEIEGIGEHYLAKLNGIGLHWQAELLDQGATKKGRIEIAEKSGVAEKLILRWVNHVDLMRIKGVGPQFAELLEAAGVDSVPELAQRKAENLQAKMTEVNAARNLVGRDASVNEVTDWIQQAKELPRVVTH